MNILVTGAKGFIGKNLIAALNCNENYTIYEYDTDTDIQLLDEYTANCGFVYHLAGVNRPEKEQEFIKGNTEFTKKLLDKLSENNNKAPVLMSSSVQAQLDNPYGRSKKAAEELVFEHTAAMKTDDYVYRLPNVFGKWCRPNYNSAVATFCHNTARDIPIKINDPETMLNLVYIDDVIDEFVKALTGGANRSGQYCAVMPVYEVKLGQVAGLIKSFNNSRMALQIPDMSDSFTKKMYSTYLSYLPEDKFSYPLAMHEDSRGSFTEFFRTTERGQVSVNISKPGITKGNHWHQSKNEKFLVVSGEGIIRFRRIDSDDIIKYEVSSNRLEVVDIPPGYTHNIENTGTTDMVTVMWVNECFEPENPDTFILNV